jgi:hypothetical protein
MISAEIAVIFSAPRKERKIKYPARTIASIPLVNTGSGDAGRWLYGDCEAVFHTLEQRLYPRGREIGSDPVPVAALEPVTLEPVTALDCFRSRQFLSGLFFICRAIFLASLMRLQKSGSEGLLSLEEVKCPTCKS